MTKEERIEQRSRHKDLVKIEDDGHKNKIGE
jgi:hypothetical protein